MTYRYPFIVSLLLISVRIFAASPAIPITDLYKLQNERELKQAVREYEKLDTYDALKRSGIAYHNLATLKIDGASEKAVQFLKRASDMKPTDSITLAYLGSATTMTARDSWNVFTKMEEANRGFNLLDKAVVLDPNNAVLRVLRINNSLQVPDFLGRKRIVKPDFAKIEQLLAENPNQLDPETVADVRKKVGKLDK